MGHFHHYWELDVGIMQKEMIPVLQSGVSGLDECVPVSVGGQTPVNVMDVLQTLPL